MLKSKGEIFNITDQDSVTICGITFSNDKEIAYRDNIKNKIVKLERQLDLWRWQNLTLEGKILIVKTFGLSQLIFSLQSTWIKLEDHAKIEDIIFRFIWKIKKDNPISSGKVKREIMKSNYDLGGLKAPDIYSIDKAIKYKNILRNKFNEEHTHPIRVICSNALFDLGLDWHAYRMTSTQKIANRSFYGVGANVHIQIGNRSLDDIKLVSQDDGVHKNYYSFIQNTILTRNRFVNTHQNNMLHRLLIYNISNLRELNNERVHPRHPNLFLDVHQIYNSFPEEWRRILNKTERIHASVTSEIPIDTNKWVKPSDVTVRQIKDCISNKKDNNNINTYLLQRHKNTFDHNQITKNPFVALRHTTKDIKVRNIQYKLLHNIYPTMSHLYKWKIKTTKLCSLCNTEETIKHAIYECPIAVSSLQIFESILGIPKLSYENVLLGCTSTITEVNKGKQSVDILLITLKQ